jgi:signal transduction histidine kinase
MPAGLPIERQKAWLQEHGYIAECNTAYDRLGQRAGLSETEARLWRSAIPWSAIYVDHLEVAARQGYCMDGLQFTLPGGDRPTTYLANFLSILEDGKLVRIWGVARDVTELVVLNERLRVKQSRLQAYAHQLVGAEERARRATAVDLHDGVGQQLVGLGMTLEVAASRAAPDVRLLLSEASHIVRDVHSTTRRVIADLSPPGLYELGLESALKWLAIQFRSKEQLQVDVQVCLSEADFDLDFRILFYKLIRELLRNVVKHAQVPSAAVTVNQTPEELHVEVIDRGVGFEWQLDLLQSRTRSFGLWSVADRVHAAGGELTVDTAPGRGCCVSIVFPLNVGRQTGIRALSEDRVVDGTG